MLQCIWFASSIRIFSGQLAKHVGDNRWVFFYRTPFFVDKSFKNLMWSPLNLKVWRDDYVKVEGGYYDVLSTQTEVKLEKEAHAHRHCQKKKVFTKLQTRPMEKNPTAM